MDYGHGYGPRPQLAFVARQTRFLFGSGKCVCFSLKKNGTEWFWPSFCLRLPFVFNARAGKTVKVRLGSPEAVAGGLCGMSCFIAVGIRFDSGLPDTEHRTLNTEHWAMASGQWDSGQWDL